ncbi:MAG: hypothetical protein WC273_07920 [Dehalococcoidia bacterium]
MRVALAISDHGWGHLNRSLVTAAEVVRRGHALALVINASMEAEVRRACPDAEVLTGPLDRGYVFAPGGSVDHDASRPLLHASAIGAPAALAEAVARWRPDVVMADATPWAPALACAADAPAVLCSNFSWDDQYLAMYGATAEVERVRAQVAAFDLGLELPLGSGLPAVAERRTVPLLAQWPGTSLPPAIDAARPLVTWTMGRTPPEAQPLDALRGLAEGCARRGFQLAVNEVLAPYAGKAAIALPDHVAWSDVLAASCLVVTKAGYSTVAEALRGPGYVAMAGVTGLTEERAMIADVEARGWGLGVAVADPNFDARFLAAIDALLRRVPRPPTDEAGEYAIVDALEAIAG